MRWYCVLCFCASRLKNSTLLLLSASVIFTPSSRMARSSGGGRKSAIIRGLPIGSSVYLIFVVIDLLSFPPVAGTENTHDAGAIGEANSKNAGLDTSKAEIASFSRAVLDILGDYTARVGKCQLRGGEIDAVLEPIRPILGGIPVESGLGQGGILPDSHTRTHTTASPPRARAEA
jgi:hypothetical protein